TAILAPFWRTGGASPHLISPGAIALWLAAVASSARDPVEKAQIAAPATNIIQVFFMVSPPWRHPIISAGGSLLALRARHGNGQVRPFRHRVGPGGLEPRSVRIGGLHHGAALGERRREQRLVSLDEAVAAQA